MKKLFFFILVMNPILANSQDILFKKVTSEYMEACEMGKEDCKPFTIERSKDQIVMLVLPCGGTQTHASLSGSGLEEALTLDIFHDDCPPKFNLTDLPDGKYSIYMTSCHVGGYCSFSLQTSP